MGHSMGHLKMAWAPPSRREGKGGAFSPARIACADESLEGVWGRIPIGRNAIDPPRHGGLETRVRGTLPTAA
jgi:hypothetical protein